MPVIFCWEYKEEYMISISTVEANTEGSIVLDNHFDSDLKSNTARVTRTSTLDGGVVVNHLGVSDGDRTFIINTYQNKTNSDKILDIFNTAKFVMVGTEEGIFYSTIKTVKVEGTEVTLTILVKSKETT